MPRRSTRRSQIRHMTRRVMSPDDCSSSRVCRPAWGNSRWTTLLTLAIRSRGRVASRSYLPPPTARCRLGSGAGRSELPMSSTHPRPPHPAAGETCCRQIARGALARESALPISLVCRRRQGRPQHLAASASENRADARNHELRCRDHPSPGLACGRCSRRAENEPWARTRVSDCCTAGNSFNPARVG